MTLTRFVVLACLLTTFAAQAPAQQDLRATLFVEADRALARARAANAELLAPAMFASGAEAYAAAESDLERGRNMERIRSELATAARAFTEAGDAAEIANVTLASVIKTRADAANANAAHVRGRDLDRSKRSVRFGGPPARDGRHSRRTRPRRRGRSALPRCRAHGDQGAVLESNARAARRSRASARAAARAAHL